MLGRNSLVDVRSLMRIAARFDSGAPYRKGLHKGGDERTTTVETGPTTANPKGPGTRDFPTKREMFRTISTGGESYRGRARGVPPSTGGRMCNRDLAENIVDYVLADGQREHCIDTVVELLSAENERLMAIEADFKAAAGDVPIPLPEPGSDLAKLVHANVMMRKYVIPELEQKVDEYREGQENWQKLVDELRMKIAKLEGAG